MRKLSEIQLTTSSQPDFVVMTKQQLDTMFARLLAICSGSMAQARRDPNYLAAVKREWFRAFKDSSVRSQEQLEAGYKELRRSGRDFLPNPGRFVEWCEKGAEIDAQEARAILESLHEFHICKRKTMQFGDRFPNRFRPIVHELYSRITYSKINTENSAENLSVVSAAISELLRAGYKEPERVDIAALPTPDQVKNNMTAEQRAAEERRNKAAAKLAIEKMMRGLK